MKPAKSKKKASTTQVSRRNIVFDNLCSPGATFPLELHAKIAALLLEGDNFEDASERAILLLNVCSRRLEQGKQWGATRRTMEKEFVRLRLDEDPVPFKRALKIITGQQRFDRAETDFLSFLQAIHPEWSKQELSGEWDRFNRNGFIREQVVDFVARFEKAHAQGRLDKRKPNRKNSVASKKRP